MTNNAASAVTSPPDDEDPAMADRDRGNEAKSCTMLSDRCNVEDGEDTIRCAQTATQRQGLATGTSASGIVSKSLSIDSST
jgi:hypothetical protein